MPYPLILSYVQVEPLLLAKQKGLQSVEVPPDLGLTMVTVILSAQGVVFPTGSQLYTSSAPTRGIRSGGV